MIPARRFSIVLALCLVQSTSSFLFAKGEVAKPEALETLSGFKVELARLV